MFNPPMEVIASRDHIMHVVYSFLQPSRVLDRLGHNLYWLLICNRIFTSILIYIHCNCNNCSTLPSIETPYPMLVLCGPQGAGKKDLALKLVDEFPDYFGYGWVFSMWICILILNRGSWSGLPCQHFDTPMSLELRTSQLYVTFLDVSLIAEFRLHI